LIMIKLCLIMIKLFTKKCSFTGKIGFIVIIIEVEKPCRLLG